MNFFYVQLLCSLLSATENLSKTMYFTTRNAIFTGGPLSKCDWASFVLVLSSNRAGFVMTTCKPCSAVTFTVVQQIIVSAQLMCNIQSFL